MTVVEVLYRKLKCFKYMKRLRLVVVLNNIVTSQPCVRGLVSIDIRTKTRSLSQNVDEGRVTLIPRVLLRNNSTTH